MNEIFSKLQELFMRFPGIGPRQAKRFVYFLLHTSVTTRQELVKLINELPQSVSQCHECFRFYSNKNPQNTTCELCRSRDGATLLICEKDVDIENMEKAGVYAGKYFILGGLVGVLEKEPEKKIRQKELLEKVEREKGLTEIIVALSANTDGDNTFSYLKKLLAPLSEKRKFKISLLGRGLSTGTELEYSDPDTIRNALKNRG